MTSDALFNPAFSDAAFVLVGYGDGRGTEVVHGYQTLVARVLADCGEDIDADGLHDEWLWSDETPSLPYSLSLSFESESLLVIRLGASARASLSTPEGGGVPEGWKLVPIEPTAEMEDAADGAFHEAWRKSNQDFEHGEQIRLAQGLPRRAPKGTQAHASLTFSGPMYCAMLAAAPVAPVSAPSVGVKVKPDAMRYKVPAAGAFDTSGEGWTWMYGPWLPSGYRDGAEPLYLHPAPTAPKGVDAREVARESYAVSLRDLGYGQQMIDDILAGKKSTSATHLLLVMWVERGARAALKAAGIPDTSEGGE